MRRRTDIRNFNRHPVHWPADRLGSAGWPTARAFRPRQDGEYAYLGHAGSIDGCRPNLSRASAITPLVVMLAAAAVTMLPAVLGLYGIAFR